MILSIIGFIVVALGGLWFLIIAGSVWFGMALFSGDSWAGVVAAIVPTCLGLFLLWAAWALSPFTIGLVG